MGYTHDAVKIFADPKTGAEQIVQYKEHYPPDTVAAIFWLKNRQSKKWRDKQIVETTNTQRVIMTDNDGEQINPEDTDL